MPNCNFNEALKELILQYFSAFANLYGIISIKRAFNIISKQNSEQEISEEEFRVFVDSLGDEGKYYIIVYESEIYACFEHSNDIFKKFIIAEHLCIEGFDDYEILKREQDGRRFYIPDKESLLKYSDDFYFERTPAYYAMENFLRVELKLKPRVEDDVTLTENMAFPWQTQLPEEDDLEFDLNELKRMAGISKGKSLFKSKQQLDQFIRLYDELRRHTRREAFRGFTAAELGAELN